MTPIETALVVFAWVLGGALSGMVLRVIVPEWHLSEDSKDVIKLGMGLIGTMAALVLGLVIATAKGSYDTLDAAVKHSAAKVLLLDRVLSNYGPETKRLRDLLRTTVAYRIASIWSEERLERAKIDVPEIELADRGIESMILKLSPKNDTQRWLQSEALRIGGEIMETRWLALGAGEGSGSIQVPFLVVVVFWLTLIFASFGLLAPRNATVITVLILCAVSVAGSFFLILELDQPFDGMMKLSSTPLRFTLSHLGR